MYEYKFDVIKQRIKSDGVKHSVTKRISNKDILLFGLGDSHPIPNIYWKGTFKMLKVNELMSELALL